MEAGIQVTESESEILAAASAAPVEPLPGPSSRLEPLPILDTKYSNSFPILLPPPLSTPAQRVCHCNNGEIDYNIMHLADRILLATWLVFLEIILVVLSSFYLWTFFTVGVPSETVMFSYWILLTYSTALFVALIFGIVGLRRTRLGDFKAMVVAYNTSMGIVILFSMALILLFGQHVHRLEILKYLTKPHIGSETFVNYIHSKFDCCVVMNTNELESSNYGFDMIATGTTMSPAQLAATFSLCPQDGAHNESCFAHIDYLAQLLAKDGEAYTIFLLQTYLPTFILVGVIVLMFLLNYYCHYAREIDEARGSKSTAIVVKKFNDASLASIVCAGFARYSGTTHPSVIPLPPRGTRSPFPKPEPSEKPTPIKSCMLACTKERLREAIPMRELKPRIKKKVTIVETGIDNHAHDDYQESELI